MLRKKAPNSIIIGFKLGENNKNVIKDAEKLLDVSKLNYVVANVLSAINSEENKVWFIDESGNKKLLKGYKMDIADNILDLIQNQ